LKEKECILKEQDLKILDYFLRDKTKAIRSNTIIQLEKIAKKMSI